MTTAEFLEWDSRQDARYEFDGFSPVAMVGGTWAHSIIRGNIVTAVGMRLRGGPCRVSGLEVKIPISSGQFRCPDAFVTCVPPGAKALTAPDPVVIFEVISDGTERIDRRDKVFEYRSIPPVQRYVIAEQDSAALTVIARTAAGWSLETLRGGEVLAIPEIGIEVPVDEFYADVAFA